VAVLPHLHPRVFELTPSPARPVLIWTDGASEPLAARPHTVGFVAMVPREGAPPAGTPIEPGDISSVYKVVHGSASLSEAYVARFLLQRKQQIGQVELIGEVVPYLSLPPSDLQGRQVMHWVDNSSAVAASVKGYSSAIDSALIVHALHATLARLRLDVWFEYVRTDANCSDDPSRADMSRVTYALGADIARGVRGLVMSSPVHAVVPRPAEWDSSAVEWMRRT
jgi:hypothetical protein